MTVSAELLTNESARPSDREVATAVVEQLEQALAEIGRHLARNCASQGTLDEGLLDLHQINCYELAFALAELECVRLFLANPSDSEDLALVFAGQTIPQIMQRLEAIAASLGLSQATEAIRSQPGFARALALAAPQNMAIAGARLCHSADTFHAVCTNDEVDLARDMFRRFAQQCIAPLAEEVHRGDLDVPDTLLDEMRKMGVFGLAIPQQYGGSSQDGGENTLTMVAVTEALSEASLGIGGSLITRPEILARAILAGGTSAQKDSWLPRIASGEKLAAIAITEPDHGSDAANLALKARKTDGGWLLSGSKTWCTFAGKAEVLMVVARTGPEAGFKGLSILLAEKPSFAGHAFDYRQEGGGRLQGKAIATIGYRGMHSFELSFEDFFVPDANLLGRDAGLGRGFYFAMNGMTGGRIQTAARACGVMIAAIAATIRYAGDRKIFGKPLSGHQLIQGKIAGMAARFMASRIMAYTVAERLDAGGGQMQASLAKLFACRSAELVTREAVQIHGGMGYAEECSVSRYFVDARVLSIFEGAEEALAIRVVARGILSDHLKDNGA